MTQTNTSDREIVVSRLLLAPKALVWKMWTDPEHLAKWWGPNGFSNTIHEMNVVTGGAWHLTMHGPNGMDFPSRMVYEEVIPFERIVYSHIHEGKADQNLFRGTATFEEKLGHTLLTLRMVFESAAELKHVAEEYGAIEGAKQTFNRLEHLLSALTQDAPLVITRTFNAPVALVYRAFSDREMLQNWWGPGGSKITVKSFEFAPGGTFHYYIVSPHGTMWGLFRFVEIEALERIVFVNSFSDEQGNITRAPFSATFPLELLNVCLFTGNGDKTTLTLRGGPLNATDEEKELYRSMVSAMEAGFGGTFAVLDQYLETIK